jgi:hypothetical protein
MQRSESNGLRIRELFEGLVASSFRVEPAVDVLCPAEKHTKGLFCSRVSGGVYARGGRGPSFSHPHNTHLANSATPPQQGWEFATLHKHTYLKLSTTYPQPSSSVWKTFLFTLGEFRSYPQKSVDIVARLWIISSSGLSFSAKYTLFAMCLVDKPVDKRGKICG